MDHSDRDDTGFEELLDESLEFRQPSRGDILDAEILEIRDSEIVVGLGAKRDGIVPSQDMQRIDPKALKALQVGDSVPVYVLNPSDKDGNLIVSLNLGLQGHDWVKAKQLLESGEVVDAEVIGFNRGGLLVQFGRLEGFVPASHLIEPVGEAGQAEQLEKLKGSLMALKVIEVNQARRRLILSEREAKKDWRTSQKKKLLGDLKVGTVVTGTVTGIRDFGAFVDVGGADGLIHVSELDWHRVPHPREVVKIGEQIEVYVLELDRDHQRIALSLKRTKPDPWDVVAETYKVGQTVEGVVSNVVDFGAFIVLPDGIEGLLHVTEMGDGTISEPYSYLKQGDKVQIHIVRIEPERKRIGFTQRDEDAIAADNSVPSADTPNSDEVVNSDAKASEN